MRYDFGSIAACGNESDEGSSTGQSSRAHAWIPCTAFTAMTNGGSSTCAPVSLETGGVALPDASEPSARIIV
eukprot:CAMPEP_0119312546 /NCGR_PEP_ID=MMETSP1333-20130426/26875_1 /TAXON_ID=418940 /ORGANISM="Scyphosphaera apsteinii, Strain RCC1455" /LENGTH=71 /DNA_ID=CAMNT_0007317187 /DNA_START=225 /DNA_END=440 /DNA_ORIENTATION=+